MNAARGTWGIRFLIHALTIALGVLVLWLLGYLMLDIEQIPGPDYLVIKRQYVPDALLEKRDGMLKQIEELDRAIAATRDQQQLVGNSSQNLQNTINQLLELQRTSIQKGVELSAPEKDNLTATLNQFLQNQTKYQELNQTLTAQTAQKAQVDEQRTQLEQDITTKEIPARQDYDRLYKAHTIRLAAYQLAILIPLLIVSGYLLIRRKGSIYYPLVLAFGGGTLARVVIVIHNYFPAKYFKYIITVALLLVVARFLLHVIRMVAYPKPHWLSKQYREAYERFLCPVCDYPIRSGPRKWLYWTRRTVHKILPHIEHGDQEEVYSCPSCGTQLFETCASCQKIRHSLMPHCDHCGAKKAVA